MKTFARVRFLNKLNKKERRVENCFDKIWFQARYIALQRYGAIVLFAAEQGAKMIPEKNPKMVETSFYLASLA